MHGTRVIQHRRKAGVSLLVVLIILAALALAAGLAIPAFFARHRVTLDNAAKLIARDLRVHQGALGLGWRAFQREFENRTFDVVSQHECCGYCLSGSADESEGRVREEVAEA